jgi:hypothetical protein
LLDDTPEAVETAILTTPEFQPDVVDLVPLARAHRTLFVDTIVPEYYPEVVEEAAVVESPVEEAPFAAEPSVRPFFVDAIVPEYYPVAAKEPDAIEVKDDIVVLIPAHPVFAEIPLLDRIIPEVHAAQIQLTAKSPLVLTAAAPTVAVALPTLGGAETSASRQPAPANMQRKPLILAGVIAASLALIGVGIWSQLPSAAPVDAAAIPEVATVQVEEPVAISVPVPVPATVELVEAAPSIPQIEIVDFGVTPDASVAVQSPAAEPAPPTQATPEPLSVAVAADAVPLPVQPAPEPPAEETVAATAGAPVLRGRVLSPGDAAQIYAATGVWQRAPRFVDVPSETSTDGLIIPFSETVPARVAQPLVPPSNDLATDLSFLAPALPPAADVEFPRGEDGFILATPEGTLTPEGAVVIAGAPDLNLRLRPVLTDADLARMALLAPAPEGVVIIAGRPDVVPPLRPANATLPEPEEDQPDAIAQQSATQEAATPGGVALSSLQAGPTPDLTATADPAFRRDGGGRVEYLVIVWQPSRTGGSSRRGGGSHAKPATRSAEQ